MGRAITSACKPTLAIPERACSPRLNIYVGLTTERADRPPLAPTDAADELRRLESQGVLEPRASRAVLVAAGHGLPDAPAGPRVRNPGGLSRREVDVLGLAAKGL